MLKNQISIICLLVVFSMIGATAAEAGLRQPRTGPEMKYELKNEQYEVARLFLALQTQSMQKSSIDHDRALQAIETVHDLVKALMDLQVLKEMPAQIDNIRQYNALIEKYLKTEHVWMNAYDVKQRRGTIVLLCALTQVLNDTLPALGLQESVINKMLSALSGNNDSQFAEAIDALFDTNTPLGFIGTTCVAVIGDVLDNLDILDSPSIWSDLKILFKSGNFFSRVKSLGPTFYAEKGIAIANDLIGAAAVNANDSMSTGRLMALEFLNYYYVTYGGDFNAFYDDLGIPRTSTIETAYKAFRSANDPNGPMQTMLQKYQTNSYINFIGDADAVALIRDLLKTTGLALRPGYLNAGVEANSLEYGKSQAVRFCLDPILNADGYALDATLRLVITNSNGQSVGTADIMTSGLCANYQANLTMLGPVTFNASYKIMKNDHLVYDATVTPKDFIRDIYVKNSDISLSNLNINSFTQQLAGSFNTGTNIKVTFSPGVFAKATHIPTNQIILFNEILGSDLTSIEISVKDNKGITIVPKQELQDGSLILPLTDTGAFNLKQGVVGRYIINYSLYHPDIEGSVDGQLPLVINYSDLGGEAFLAPYIEIQASGSVRNLSSSATALKLTSADTVRLCPRNFPGWPDLKALTGAVSVWLMDSDNNIYQVPAILTTDGGVEFKISNTMPTNTDYTLFSVSSLDGTTKHSFGTLLTATQLVELDPATGGTGTPPPPSTTGTITLPRTGQYTSYATGDDGAIQAGAAWPIPRFTDNNNGTVTDNLTGLVWLKNANCTDTAGGISKTYELTWPSALVWSSALANNICGLSDGSASGQWRLPNRKEIMSLMNRNRSNLASWLNTVGFTNVQGYTNGRQNRYWSSSTYRPYVGGPNTGDSYAWVEAIGYDYMYLDEGHYSIYNKVSSGYVWPVRDP